MTEARNYPSLADFASTWHARDKSAIPPWVLPQSSRTTPVLDDPRLRNRLDDVIDTVVAVQRADRLEDGVYIGPRTMPDVYRELLDVARLMRVTVPPAIVTPCSHSGQGTFGTDDRAFLQLSSFYLRAAPEAERRFLLGRLCGHIAARQVTWTTLFALLAEQGGLRKTARKALGPTLEVFLAPISLGVRVVLARWHRAAELSADRAGLLAAGDFETAGRALLRIQLAVKPDMDADDYLTQLRSARERHSPGRWTEFLASQPWMHKRLTALELFASSQLWVDAGNEPIGDAVLTADELDERMRALLAVGQ